MKIINRSKNTVYVDDIDQYIQYTNKVEHISSEQIKKSQYLRNFILSDACEIVEHNKNERIEQSLVFLKNKKQAQTVSSVSPPEIKTVSKVSHQSNLQNIEVKVHGLFLDASGYAKVNRNLATGLSKAGFSVKVDSKQSSTQINEEELRQIFALQQTQISRNYISIDSIVPSFSELSGGKYKILYSTVESYTIPKQFIDSCQMYDEIWLTSEWSANILREHKVNKPIYAVCTGVDQHLYTEKGPKYNLPNIKDFVFISVFGWNYRKGNDVLLRAYLNEFSAEDNVSLLITSRYQGGRSQFHKKKIPNDIEEVMKEFPNKSLAHIARYSKIVPESEMPLLYRAADCFVLPTRGEGGGLPPLEASLCGLPVIMTNCSGQQGYLRADNSYMLEIDHLETVSPGRMHLHYWDGQKFPCLRTDGFRKQLQKAMREVFENHEKAKEKNKNLQKRILQNFTWNSTIASASERLQSISRKLGV